MKRGRQKNSVHNRKININCQASPTGSQRTDLTPSPDHLSPDASRKMSFIKGQADVNAGRQFQDKPSVRLVVRGEDVNDKNGKSTNGVSAISKALLGQIEKRRKELEEASRPVKIGRIEAVKPIKIPAGSVQPVIMTPKIHGKIPRRNPYEQEENKKSLCN